MGPKWCHFTGCRWYLNGSLMFLWVFALGQASSLNVRSLHVESTRSQDPQSSTIDVWRSKQVVGEILPHSPVQLVVPLRSLMGIYHFRLLPSPPPLVLSLLCKTSVLVSWGQSSQSNESTLSKQFTTLSTSQKGNQIHFILTAKFAFLAQIYWPTGWTTTISESHWKRL